MSVERDIRWELIARLTGQSTGAELRSVATEAGMFAIRARRKVATEKDFLAAVEKVSLPFTHPYDHCILTKSRSSKATFSSHRPTSTRNTISGPVKGCSRHGVVWHCIARSLAGCERLAEIRPVVLCNINTTVPIRNGTIPKGLTCFFPRFLSNALMAKIFPCVRSRLQEVGQ